MTVDCMPPWAAVILSLDLQAASSKRWHPAAGVNAYPPFDDSEVFRIPYLVADAERHRLLFLLYQKPQRLIYYDSAMIPPKDTTNGLWEYDLKTKDFKRHLELYHDAFLWGSPIRNGHVLLSKTGIHRTGVMDFDLASNKGNLLWGVNPIGPNLPKESARSQEDYYPFYNVQLLRGNWLWCVHPFSRASLTDADTNPDLRPRAARKLFVQRPLPGTHRNRSIAAGQPERFVVVEINEGQLTV